MFAACLPPDSKKLKKQRKNQHKLVNFLMKALLYSFFLGGKT
jgi:hypothetical protein